MKTRKLVVFLATAMLMLPLAVFALGFGGIKLNSALGEPFDAEIELVSPTPDDIANLKIKLASPDAFLRAGIDRPSYLTDLRFAIKQRENGSYYIHVTSRKPIREPFMDVLLEMDWQNGRMLREYTVLLDPPSQVKKQPTVVEAPVSAPAAPPAPAPAAAGAESPFVPAPSGAAPAPAMEAMPAASEPTELTLGDDEKLPRVPLSEAPEEPEPVAEAPSESAPAQAPAMVEEAMPRATPGEAPQMAMAPEAAVFEEGNELFPRIPIDGESSAEPLGELDYGIVKKGDNLWTIAEKLRPNDSVSIYQVMMALLRSNPDAFVDGNINRLKAGHVLRIDNPDLLTSISKQEAAREYQAQTLAWEEYRQQVAGNTAPQPIVASEEAAPVQEEAPASSELTLASPAGDELQAGTGASEQEAASNEILTLQDELRELRESAAAAGGRNEELNARLREMEDALERMQRAVSIKDDELAAMQQQMAQLKDQATAPAEPATEPAPAPAEAEQAAPLAGTEPAAESEPEPETAAAEEAPVPEAPASEARSPVELAEDIARQEQAAPEPAASESFMDKVMGWFKVVGDTLTGMFGGLAGGSLLTFVALPVVLVLLLLMIIVIRRRRKSDAYQESILTGGPSSVTASAAAAEESEEESSFLSDFAVSGAGAIQTEDSEVDPLTEADVFIAYGRYEAAEERLKEAIQKDPQRAELKLKLLELYHTTKNKPAFENAAEEFYASLGDNANDNPMWQKVVAMGAELIPGNPLFSGAAAAGGAALADMASPQDPGVGLSDSQVMDIGLDTGVFDAADLGTAPAQPAAPAEPAQAEPAAADMDFNLDLGETPAPAAEPQTASAGGDMDFNLDLDDSTAAPESAGGDLDFSLDLEKASTPASGEAAEAESGGLDFNLDMGAGSEEAAGLDFNLGEEPAATAAPAEEAGSLDFDLDLAETGSDDTAEFNLDMATDLDMNDATMAVDLGSEPALESSGSTPEPTMDLELDASEAGDLDIGSSDEVGTKLDLAKAYIDMGDPDGARSILDEVLDEGNDSQKQEAQELLQQIA